MTWASTTLHAFGGEAEVARFRAEYPPAARRRVEAAERVRGVGRVAGTGADGRADADEFRFASDHGCK